MDGERTDRILHCKNTWEERRKDGQCPEGPREANVALSRRPVVYGKDSLRCALFTFAQFAEISWPMELSVRDYLSVLIGLD
jgi:hypothetical protein